MEWKWDISTALAVVNQGWSTEAERMLLKSASAFIAKVAAEAHANARKNATCRTCGHNPFDDIGD